jgi:hypothetical protein
MVAFFKHPTSDANLNVREHFTILVLFDQVKSSTCQRLRQSIDDLMLQQQNNVLDS